ncbi:DUF4150 domain-containing protein [Xenorhabdus nematophila]|uniref:Uncharacterized protein n=1 Tax=Xenorhabdus nematophila (strain ATCC 19061 / DSM 3370 / CCUG 14189 / LMG 1036 / NCIMB 9965 / AN6) TaxID=406817 RepID=D3VHD2_XENNA|nr:DUF4150 domain-containing protein [Xenorhabdus nematophila]AYA40075.1 DUF4150 domain-containing protein [Xenorhabdus nematophila]KHD29518.1 type VI secretion protein [Xenorhabdus nematophila]MBA0018722.1 DUF4150 domain-containing protein [Xenorhabdus nematophila]MCB4425312.1 DUF4150 domain-containing protein [Xenorhabdus nematophila]QNJ37721.1 DUF4150 domain-containing protein [Xenorhabdus nematophila]
MFANTQSGGMDMATPDICLTPMPFPVPVPYPNTAQGATGISNAMNILFMGCPAHNLATSIPMTTGDNAGVSLGVASGMVMGPSRHTMGANSVLIKGTPATRLSSCTMQNSTNAVGSRIVPSQTKVLISAA